MSRLAATDSMPSPRKEAPSSTGRPLRIEPPGRRERLDWAELWSYRELLYFFVWRDLKVRYKQTVLGVLWAVLQPALTMLVFVVFFGRLGGLARHVDGAYPVFIFAGLLPWTFFSTAVTQASASMMGASNLLSKVYFPRVLIPLAAVLGGLLDLAIAFLVLLALMLGYGVMPGSHLLLLPFFVGSAIVTAAGMGFLLSALVVAYRDFRYVVGFLLQLWMFASPVVYPLNIIPESWRLAYALNPMVGVLTGFRSATLGTALETDIVAVSTLSGVGLLVFGLRYFLGAQRRFADII